MNSHFNFFKQFALLTALVTLMLCSTNIGVQAQKSKTTTTQPGKLKAKKAAKAIKDNTIKSITTTGMPEIIDREIFFGDPEVAGAQLSPDGKYMSFIKPYNKVRNIWIKGIDEAFEKARPVTADTAGPIPGYFWTHDSKYIMYVQDKGGNENFNVYALNPAEELKEGQVVPEARNLTGVESVRTQLYNLPESDHDLIYIGLNDRDASWHDLYAVKISTGEKTLIKKNEERISGWTFDNADQLRLASRTTDDGGTEFLKVTKDGFESFYNCNNEESCGLYRFHKDDKEVYMVSNKGDRDLMQLVLFNLETGKETLVEGDPLNQVDFGRAFFSDVTKELIATRYIGDKPRMYFIDKSYEEDYNNIKKELPNVEIYFGSSTKDEKNWLIYGNSDVDPGAAYLYNRDTKKLTYQYSPRPELPKEHLTEMKPVRYKSSDGLEIPAYLTLPKGVKAENLPAIMLIHGGPWARDRWGYDPFAQFWANRGYAVLQPNFRGSTGYGKAFLNAGNLEWGELMQDDITWGAKYLVEQGIAAEDKIAIMGGSYGGYATLAGVTFTPDVYAAGVSIVGPSNLLTLLESIPPYWEAIRKLFHKRMGNPETEEGKKKLMEQSPLFSADKIKVPLMVVQGANDPRVKQAESDQIVIAMRELKLPVAYLVAEDEGHGFRKPDNMMAFIASAEKFLAKHVGGRFQEDIPDNILAKQKDLVVDINTVKLAKQVDEGIMTAPIAAPAVAPTAQSYEYQIVVSMGGQKMPPMNLTRTVEAKDDKWVISDVSASPMGNMTDVSELDKASLQPISRKIEQGPVVINLNHTAEKITGSMSMQGKAQPIDQALEAPALVEGAGLDLWMTSLPLAADYTTTYRTFDVQMQKIKAYNLKVVGEEEIEVAAGKFKTFKVELTQANGEGKPAYQWICVEEGKRCLVKSTSVMAQMGADIEVTLSGIK